jgi:GT2 family glycosyltransferase
MPTATAEIRNVWSASMMVRRDAFTAVGGFRTGFGKLGDRNRPEDTELCLRMSADGGRWMYVPGALIDHEVPADRARFAFLLRRCYAEGRGKVQMAKLLPRTQRLDAERDYVRRILPRAVARNLVAAGHGRGMAHALRAVAVVAAVAAAGVGGGLETLVELLPTDLGDRTS